MADGRMVVELYCVTTNETISSITVPNGSPAALTGAIDLPMGEHEICIRMYPQDYDGWGDWSGANLQVIVGQTVDERGCVVQGGGGCS
jgi:hypothetical protein